MKITLDADLEKMVENLPTTVVNQCVAPAARAMGDLIIAKAQSLAPRGDEGAGKGGKGRFAGVAPRDRMSKTSRAFWGEHNSGDKLMRRFWRTSRGGILYVGQRSPLGNKMHFRLPVLERHRRVFYWGRDAEKVEPLEQPHYLERAELETRSAAASVFKSVFTEKFKELKLG